MDASEDDKSLNWQERKEAYHKKIQSISKEGALVKTADMLQNLYDFKQTLKTDGIKFLNNFNASYEQKIEHTKKQLVLINKYHKNSLVKDVQKVVQEIQEIVENMRS